MGNFLLAGFAVPAEYDVKIKESEHIEKYLDHARELKNFGAWYDPVDVMVNFFIIWFG